MAISRESVEEVLKEEERYWRLGRLEGVTIEEVAAAGNSIRSILRADLSLVLASGKKTTSSVILKALPSQGSLNTCSLFATEIKVYTDILPLMEEVLKEQNIPTLWPGYLGQIGNTLVFKDLAIKNYKVCDRIKRLDLDHAFIAVRTLALFHSASVVLEERGLLDVKDIPASFHFNDTPAMKEFVEQPVRTAAKVIIHEWGPHWTEIGERLYRKSYTIHDDLLRLTAVNKNKLNVLCHGDPWTANLMFKYSKATDRPLCVRLLDFQNSHYNSHVYDLVYFIQSSVRPDLRRAWTKKMLEDYRDTLEDSLDSYGLAHLCPSLEDIEAEYDRLQLASLLYSLTVMAVGGSSAENGFSMNALYEEGAEPFNPEVYRGTFKEDINVELIKWAEMGLF